MVIHGKDYCPACKANLDDNGVCVNGCDELKQLRQQLAASQDRERLLREVLAWYADMDNYMPQGERLYSAMLNDGGFRAREALKETETKAK